MRTVPNIWRGVLAVLWVASPVGAVVERPADPLDALALPPARFQPLLRDAAEGAPEAAGFRARHPGTWRLTVDGRTGRLALAAGSGIPLLPGRGNQLSAAAAGLAGPVPTIAEADKRARAFLAGEGALLLPGVGELRLSEARSGPQDGGRLWYLDFDWFVDGVRVDGARVFLRVNHGNIIQMGSYAVGEGLPSTTPTLSAAEALGRGFAHAGGRRADDRVLDPGSLRLLPLEGAAGIDYRLAWRAAFRRGGRPATWAVEVDAHSGEVLAFHDSNRYARVTAGIYPRGPQDAEEERPLTRARVEHGGLLLDTGDPGTYAYDGGPASTALDGTFVRVSCIGCRDPERAFAFRDQGTGDLRLGSGGADEAGNGTSTPAERNAFFHLNRVRALGAKWLSLPWLDATLTANVNIDDTCNAFWDGSSVNFFRSGGGCNNTGEIADVMSHEWGHGLDGATLAGDGSTGEGTADIVAMHLSHDAQVGPHFFTTGAPVRDLDSTRAGYVARADNVGLPPPAGPGCIDCSALGASCSDGPLGHEVHCEGEIFGQMHWDLALLMTTKHGFNTGWQDLERIYFLAMPQTAGFLPGGAGNAYDAYLAVDDDNGNLADGTPNCDEIFAAFDAHAIAGPDCGSSAPGCARPPEPVVTATPGTGQVSLSWAAVPGAVSYRVLRADLGAAGAYLPVGTTAATAFADATVQPGLTYDYVVEAEDAGGCRSTIESSVAAAAAAGARLDLAGVLPDDDPAGNRSGFADPGEAIDLTLPLHDALPADGATAAQGTLTSFTPGATTAVAVVAYGPVPPDGTVDGTAYRLDLDGSLACGSEVALGLDLVDGSGAPATPARVDLLLGERVPRFADDFEIDRGWTLGAGTAITGLWARGDPVGTSWQPERDSPDAGSTCLFSGQNTSDGSGDIDGGETVILSPVIDLSGATAARLWYRRWWAASVRTDPANFFAVEVSDDAGASWIAVETIGSDRRALAWRPVDVRLETLIALNGQFRIRVRAADLGVGDLVEAAIDDVSVDEVACDLTPPCFVAPTFAGAAAASPGASCAEVDVTWSPATSNCANATLHYDVHRSTDAGFTPGPESLVASRVAGTSFHDTLLQPGLDYHYIVRALDSRAGADANLTTVAVTAPDGDDSVAPVFAGIATAAPGAGCGEVALTWPAAAETCSGPVRYDVHRSPTPGFTPGPANLAASTLSTAFVDTALPPAGGFHYIVRSVDTAGNDDGNVLQASATATVLDTPLLDQPFEGSDGGWGAIAPNDAATGRWEWGDPEGTGVQPEDDATADPGENAWITGLAGLGGIGGNDIDGGTTTLSSPYLDLTGAIDPLLEMSVFFVNDAGAAPGEDPFQVHVSDDGGASWNPLLVTLASIPGWEVRQFPLTGVIAPGPQFRVRVTAEDTASGSLVEAGVDDVRLIEPATGCLGCPLPPPEVAAISVTRNGDDIVVDWADPGGAASFSVYLLSGPSFAHAVRAGTSATTTFAHQGAALLRGESFYYRVTAVDPCGLEADLP